MGRPRRKEFLRGRLLFERRVGATVGTGNIVGVSSAIAIGGPGALFWMFVCGFIAMGIKYAEVTLGVEYREKLSNGQYRGGPFMYILKSLGLSSTVQSQAAAIDHPAMRSCSSTSRTALSS